ncbi:alpha/beta hydrolase [Nocardioides aequoreus]|uniref:alpha/beta hydrolase n=1 Tax=Nocardioides aequoreus TaxID=397278 RepID=UPI000A0014EC|nr:alpha/beta hydrolase [Nocardioides aequoreus]
MDRTADATTSTSTSTEPDTVVLVHGLWVTPAAGSSGCPTSRRRDSRSSPAYPGFDIEVEALREKPDLIAELSVNDTVEHLADVVAGVRTPPIIMGHSFGGTLTQLLLARGLGSAGVVIDSAPMEGVRVNPISQARSLFPALKNPANRKKAVGFTAEEWHYAFANTLSAEDSPASWERYAIPAPGHWVFEYGLFATSSPATRTPGSTTPPTGRRCSSSPARRTTSCPRR